MVEKRRVQKPRQLTEYMRKIHSTYLPAVITAGLVSIALASIATVEVLYLRFSLETGYAMIGSVLGLSALTLVFFAPILSKVAHKMGRGLFLVWSALLLACASVAASLIVSAGMYVVPKLLLAMLSPLIIPVVIELVRDEFQFAKDLDRLLMTLIITISFAGAIGAVSAGSLAQQFGLHYAYMFSAIVFFAAGLFALSLPRTPPPRTFKKISSSPLARLSVVFIKPLKSFVFIAFALQAYWAVRDIVLPLVILESGSVAHVGIVFGAMSLLSGLGALVGRRLLHKNPPPSILVSLLGVGAVCALLMPFGPLLMLGFVAAGFSFSDAAANPALSDAIESVAPKRSAHLIWEGMRVVSALAWVVTPIIIGLLLEAGMPAHMVLFFAGIGMMYTYVRFKREWSPDNFFPRLSVKRKKRFSW